MALRQPRSASGSADVTVNATSGVAHNGLRRATGGSCRLGASIALAVALLAAAAGCTSSATPAALPGKAIEVIAPSDRAAAPPLRGDLLDGSGTFDIAEHAGNVIVVNFWASWCAPCVAEADDLQQTYLATSDQKVIFLGVNNRDDRDKAKSFLVGRATYPSVFDPAGRLSLGFSIPPTAIPTTLIIDRQARVAVVIRSAVLRSNLEPLVRQIAAEPT